jgi:predicted RNA-binding protein with PUA-like domain
MTQRTKQPARPRQNNPTVPSLSPDEAYRFTNQHKATTEPASWLMKSEPTTFSFDDLLASPDQISPWDGVRNYQARNFMRDVMRMGDRVLFYHSSIADPAVVGVAEVVSESYPDPTQFDEKSAYYDPKSERAKPRWWLVDVKAVAVMPKPVLRSEMHKEEALQGLSVLQKGSRLSIHPIPVEAYRVILRMGGLEEL